MAQYGNPSTMKEPGAIVQNRGLSAARETLMDQIHRASIINDNLRQAIINIYGPFPPTPAAQAGAERSPPDDLSGLLDMLVVKLREAEHLSTLINVGHQ